MDPAFCTECGAKIPFAAVSCGICHVPIGTDEPLPLLGTVLGKRYELLALVGRGGMGGVFRAWDRQLEREVAVKVLDRTLSRSREVVTRFLNEARRASAIDHPNIVPIYDVGRDGKDLYFVMRLLRGYGLETRVPGPPMAIAEALEVASGVLSGLVAIHDAGLVHRDVKPANVFLEPGRVLLLDFGILHATNAARLTEAGVAVGTPDYMSPEVIRGARADARSDLFAIGMLLYEMLAGRYPYEREPVDRGPPPQAFGTPTPLRDVAPDVSLPLAALVMKALAREPEERFQSAGEMLAGIGTARSERVRVAERTTEDAPIVPAARKARLGRTVGLSVAALAIAVGVAAWTVRRGPEAAPRASRASIALIPLEKAPEPEVEPPAPATAIAATAAPETPRPRTARAAQSKAPRPSGPLAAAQTALAAGRAGEAALLFGEAARSGNVAAYRGLGESYERLGNRNAAMGAYRRYLAARPDAPDARFVERRLRALAH